MSDSRDPVRRTVAAYDAHVISYAQINASVDPLLPLLEAFLRLLPDARPARVLDVGCGHGRDARYLNACGLDVTGVDLSFGLLTWAARQAPGASFALSDMRQLSFAPAVFDGLWVCASLLHTPHDQVPAVLQGFRRVMRSGGLLYVGVKAGQGEDWVESPALGGEQRFFTYFTPQSLTALVRRAGFQPLELMTDATWVNLFARAN